MRKLTPKTRKTIRIYRDGKPDTKAMLKQNSSIFFDAFCSLFER